MHAQTLPDDFDERTGDFIEAVMPEKRGPGRPPGSKNKPKRESAYDILEGVGVDPIMGMALIAQQAEASGKPALALKAYSELAQYAHAKLKSVEHTIPDDGPMAMALRLSSAERMLRITELMTRLGKVGVNPNQETLPPPER